MKSTSWLQFGHYLIIPISTMLFFANLFRVFILSQTGLDFFSLAPMIFFGTIFDLTVTLYLCFPFVALVASMPEQWIRKRRFRYAFLSFYGFLCFFLVIVHTGEYFFFDEFHDRLNFIAVDYLVYTQEVLKNIWESYNISLIIICALIVAIALTTFANYCLKIITTKYSGAFPLKKRAVLFISYALVTLASTILVNEQEMLTSQNNFVEMLSKNGLHSLFAAYRNNEIKFDRFYPNITSKSAAHLVHEYLEEGFGDHIDEADDDEYSETQNILDKESPKKLNVILVLMESLSAKYMATFGSKDNITPNLDRLAIESIFFDNLYATGTRTVRGIEAVMLSLPPTPGQSIVRRPAGQGVFNLGSVLRQNGYSTSFIYGGYSLFDNMKSFFEGNGFAVLDQASFSKNEISFSNAWGVSDEDLFKEVLVNADQKYKSGQPFFQFVLTTSNHRPFTYPEGKIDIASGTSRMGAVKYADFAIGRFISEAKTKNWFKDTIFVFVSDHNASVAGGTGIDPKDYHIPVLFYGPAHVLPKRISTLASQIDIGPTLFDFLNFSYQSRFFGHSLLDTKYERAFLSTYQEVGYMNRTRLAILSPIKRIREFEIPGLKEISNSVKPKIEVSPADDENPSAVLRATAFYKVASDWFTEHLFDERIRIKNKVNARSQ